MTTQQAIDHLLKEGKAKKIRGGLVEVELCDFCSLVAEKAEGSNPVEPGHGRQTGSVVVELAELKLPL